MLPKIYRLKKKDDFARVFHQKRSFKELFLILKKRPNDLNCSRFGIIVSSKISKKATVRNRIRRIISEIVRLNLTGIKKSQDMVFITMPGIDKKNYKEIEENVKKLLF